MMGWKNYETWNVTLWLANDVTLQRIARSCRTKTQLVKALLAVGIVQTPDGVHFANRHVNAAELRKFLKGQGPGT